jgi:hypothetical protein
MMKDKFKIKNSTLKPKITESEDVDTCFYKPTELQELRIAKVEIKGTLDTGRKGK